MFTVSSYSITRVAVMMHHTAYSTIVFDLDGTLLDTWPGLLQIVRHAAPGQARLDTAALRRALSLGIAPMFERAAAQLALSAPAAAAFVAGCAQHLPQQAPAYEGCDTLLNTLRAAGLTLALCTNRDRASTLALLQARGWLAHFSHIHCLGDGLPAKPDPAPLLATLARLDCPPAQALFVGDSRIDAQCAANSGLTFAAHLGGYHSDLAELAPAALHYDHPRHLLRWLAQTHPRMLETEHG